MNGLLVDTGTICKNYLTVRTLAHRGGGDGTLYMRLIKPPWSARIPRITILMLVSTLNGDMYGQVRLIEAIFHQVWIEFVHLYDKDLR